MNARTRSSREMPNATADPIRRMLQMSPTRSSVTANDEAKASANRKDRIAHGHLRRRLATCPDIVTPKWLGSFDGDIGARMGRAYPP
jgi:hypothetical protein